jgi:sulfoxide reductase catalytic subunit YedY
VLIRRPPDVRSSEITPESLYVRRREFIAAAGLAAAGLALPAVARGLTARTMTTS